MSLKKRIREELDKGTGYDIDRVVNTLVEEGLSVEELREALYDEVRTVMKTRSVGSFFSEDVSKKNTRYEDVTPGSSYTREAGKTEGGGIRLKPQSSKVSAYQNGKLDEVYSTPDGYKRLSEMTRADVVYNMELVNNQIVALNGRLKGWRIILDKLDTYGVGSIDELPDSVKRDI